MRIWFAIFLIFAAASTGPSAAGDLGSWGIVILHGKSGPGRALDPMGAALRASGARVAAPNMSWLKSYQTYEATLDEVAKHIESLRSQGATRIAIVGQSLGANVALGYGARRGGVEAIIAVSPGHQPDRFLRFSRESLVRAKQMVADGHARETAQFIDVNQGRPFNIKTTAEAYVSFFDPDGPALMRRNVSELKTSKVLWIVGSKDKAAHEVIEGGKVVHVQGDHYSAGSSAAREAVAWLGRL